MRPSPRRPLRRRITLVPAVAALTAGLLLSPGAGSPASATVVPSPGLPSTGVADPNGVQLTFGQVAGGLVSPVLVQTANDGLTRMFVVERGGRIKVYNGVAVQATPYLDITAVVNAAGGEQGLLGLAFSPRFLTDHHFWVAYTNVHGSLQISRFTAASATAPTVSASTETKLLAIPHPTYSNHNSGMLVFGREGMLYASTGDGGGGGDPFGNALDRTSLSGKILRLDPFNGCNSKHYCTPKSNPYYGSSSANGLIWLYGVRNAWRFSVDRATGDLWIADVGQDRYEEVTRVPYAHFGWNLGWSCREARTTFNSGRCSSAALYHDPTIAYSHSSGEAVVGGYVYRGSTYAGLLGGLYVFGDWASGHVWVYGHGVMVRVGELGTGRLSSFGQDDVGDLWATTLDGGLFKVVAAAG